MFRISRLRPQKLHMTRGKKATHDSKMLRNVNVLYINDIDYNLLNTKVKLDADDTVMYSTNKDETTAYAHAERDLNVLMNWCENNQLTVNIKKTKLVLFGTKEMLCNSRHIDMYMGAEKLQYVNDYMYLGIKLDNKFTFKLHANECCRHVIHTNYILSKIRRYINTHQALTFYKSMIMPYFCYGDVLCIILK